MDNKDLALVLLAVALSATVLNFTLTLTQSDSRRRTRVIRSSQIIIFLGFGGFVLLRFA